ncbi:hypothetical protein AB1Y20_001149 [Prymnesium parvum]|uniref:Uncharacterized protein n=1 Tax=Prymnesium parvum TaxID=97485 RepID=A0AB34K6V9_PRYPA
MGPARNAHPRPRRQGGGRSVYYEERRCVRGTVGRYAAEWSDAAAQATFDALHEGSRRLGTGICAQTDAVLTRGAAGVARFVARECRGISATDRALASEIMGVHAERMAGATTRIDRDRRVAPRLADRSTDGADCDGEGLAIARVLDESVDDAGLRLLEAQCELGYDAPSRGVAAHPFGRVSLLWGASTRARAPLVSSTPGDRPEE